MRRDLAAGIVAGNATIAFWTPSIIKETGVTDAADDRLPGRDPVCGRHHRHGVERRPFRPHRRAPAGIAAIASLIAAIGLAATGALIGSGGVAALVALTVAAIGILAAFPVF